MVSSLLTRDHEAAILHEVPPIHSSCARAHHDEGGPSTDAEWIQWIATNTAQDTLVPSDYGLGRIARFLGPSQEGAYQLALEAADLEANGEIKDAIKKYAAAYRQWASLDSIISGGIPVDVRKEADQVGFLKDPTNVLLDVVDVPRARASAALCSRERLLSDADISNLEEIQQEILGSQSALSNNPENQRHFNKKACMVNNPPNYALQATYPSIVGRILRFAQRAWDAGDWSGPGGPLEDVKGDGIKGLSIRVIELWDYSVGGGLTDSYHYDTDSIVTIVTLLSDPDDFAGGDFRTFEVGDTHKSYDMRKGEAVAFVSHKYHNITELTRGSRRSLVMELWQGGVGHMER